MKCFHCGVEMGNAVSAHSKAHAVVDAIKDLISEMATDHVERALGNDGPGPYAAREAEKQLVDLLTKWKDG